MRADRREALVDFLLEAVAHEGHDAVSKNLAYLTEEARRWRGLNSHRMLPAPCGLTARR
jgi:hypothetical protein